MNLYLRLLIVVLVEKFRAHASVAYVGKQSFRVLPHDIDAFGHMNNGRFLQIMDVARAGWMTRTGVLGIMVRNRWSATLGGTSVRFRRTLKAFQRYHVTTRLICYDDHWFYLEHAFITRESQTVAVGISRAALRKKGGWMKTRQVMDMVDPLFESAPMPAYIRELYDAEHKMYQAFSSIDSKPVLDSRTREVTHAAPEQKKSA